VLSRIGQGLMWVGVSFGMDATVAAQTTARARHAATQEDHGPEHPDQVPMTPLSRSERAEWAALVEYLR
jgi:hypothetical protein